MQRSRVSHHPCHRLSVPSAKRFWCRHCMMVFEDAITRWRHSRSCRSGGFDSLNRRREIETQSLQKMAETLDPNMVTQITVPREDGSSKDLCCFICRQRFVSLDDMREHVKYPCNKPSSTQRNSLPMNLFPEPTFGTGIQQHYTDGPVLQSYNRAQQASSSASTSDPQALTVYMNHDGDQGHDGEAAKPTNIYVNENGETVIEVENLDLNTKSGELSLAHLLTQLSQQGIVFDQQPQGVETEVVTSVQEHQDSLNEVDFSQPTAVDAANTLTQLAGSAFRAVNNAAQETAYAPPVKRIKTEDIELQYHALEQPQYSQLQQPAQVQTYLQKEEPYVEEEEPSEKYIICTNESDVIRVVRANDVPAEVDSGGSAMAFQNGDSGVNEMQNSLAEGEVEQQTVLIQGQAGSSSQSAGLQQARSASVEHSLRGSQMIVLQQGDAQIITTPAGQVVKTEGGSSQVAVEEQTQSIAQQPVELMTAYASQEGSVAVMQQQDTVAVMQSQDTVAVMQPQDTVVVMQPEDSVAVIQEQDTVAVMQSEDSVAVIEQQDTVAVIEQADTEPEMQPEGSVAEMQPKGSVAEMQPEGSVAAEGSVAVMQPEGTVAVVQPEGSVAEMQPEGSVAEMQPEGSVAEMQPEGSVAEMQPEGSVAEMQPEGSVAEMQPEGTVAVMQQEGCVEGSVGVMEEHIEEGQENIKGGSCLVMPASGEEMSVTLASDSAVTGLLEMSGVAAATVAATRDSQQAVVTKPQSALLLPQIVTVASSSMSDDVPQLVIQRSSASE